MSLTDYPEPEGKIAGQERNSTTLTQCGWCEYATGVHRYNYCIEGKCQLLKDYDKDVHWDDTCHLKIMSRTDFNALIEHKNCKIRSAESSIKRYKKHIDTLEILSQNAIERPPLPNDRKHDHFNINDEIALFYENTWYFGEVRHGYRHHDGCVSYWLKDVGPQTKEFWGCGYAIPYIMLKSEYDFFADNLEEYKKWSQLAYDKKFNGEELEIAKIS